MMWVFAAVKRGALPEDSRDPGIFRFCEAGTTLQPVSHLFGPTLQLPQSHCIEYYDLVVMVGASFSVQHNHFVSNLIVRL